MGETEMTEMDTDRHAAPTELGAVSITGSINMPLLTELCWCWMKKLRINDNVPLRSRHFPDPKKSSRSTNIKDVLDVFRLCSESRAGRRPGDLVIGRFEHISAAQHDVLHHLHSA